MRVLRERCVYSSSYLPILPYPIILPRVYVSTLGASTLASKFLKATFLMSSLASQHTNMLVGHNYYVLE